MAPKKAAPKKAPPKAAPKKGTKAKKNAKASEPASSKPAAVLFEKRPKNFSIGQDLPVKRDLTRFVKWPKYVNRQRQKVVLKKRLRVPPAINQFSNTVDRHLKKEVMKFALKYKPEDKATKRVRLTKWAKAQLHSKSRSKPVPAKNQVTYGIQQVTRLVERKRAKLVLIAHDVDPIELVLFMPTLCKKMEVPYCIVKGKAMLGRLVGKKKCTCVAFTNITGSDKPTFDKICESVKLSYNDRYEEINKKWGGLTFSRKSKNRMAKKKALAAKR
jgi:large subunit ribosomal protein L7Ae